MDGKFVEKDTKEIMYNYACTIKQISSIALDVHLMVENIKENIEKYLPLNPNIITIHYEACRNDEEVLEIIEFIKSNNMKCGISIKPNTKLEKIEKFIKYINMVLIMTVEPGKGGQELIPETIDKIKDLKKYIEEYNLDTYIEVDGGVNEITAEKVKRAGADILVAGSAIINAKDYKKVIDILKK